MDFSTAWDVVCQGHRRKSHCDEVEPQERGEENNLAWDHLASHSSECDTKIWGEATHRLAQGQQSRIWHIIVIGGTDTFRSIGFAPDISMTGALGWVKAR